METLIRYGIGKARLELIKMFNTAEQDMPLQDVIDYVGYHPIRLQNEVRCGMRRCGLCNFRCAIATRDYGRCHAVANAGMSLVSTNYELVTGVGTTNTDFDFLHFQPNATVLYVAGLGCNFHCDVCLNATISHVRTMNRSVLSALVKEHLQPSDVVDMAKKSGVKGIVFGGNEPTVNLDFVLDTAALAKQVGLFVAYQTNGYCTPEAIELLAGCVDAVVVGLKAFGDADAYAWLFNRSISYDHVLESIKSFHARGVHVEVTGLSLKSANIETSAEQTAIWLATNVNTEIPLHIHRMAKFYSSRWQNCYELSDGDAAKLAAICRDAGLVNVYNRCAADDLSTTCPVCHAVVVERTRREAAPNCNANGVVTYDQAEYAVRYASLEVVDGKGYCANCGKAIYGAW